MKIKKNAIVTGLDIGSSRISAVAAEVSQDGRFTILAQVSQPSKGISRGVIVDLNDAVRAVSSALKKISGKMAKKPSGIYVGISAESISGNNSKGMIPLSVRGREITRLDMDRCINAASTIHLPFDREVLHRMVHRFSVDDQPWVKDPKGLYASRLACEVYVITANMNHIQNIYKCVNSAGYDAKELIFTGIADGVALLDNEQKEVGAILLNIGSSLTEVSLFFDGALLGLDVIPAGADDVKGNFREDLVFNNTVARIGSKIQDFLKAGNAVKSVTITGSMAFTDGVVEFLEEKLAIPVRMGVVKDIRGDISSIESLRLATALGLVKYACGKHIKSLREEKNPLSRITATVVDIFNNYF